MARLRHPSILEVVEPVSESRSSIVFVTEPLIGCLTHLVKSSDSYSSESIEQNLDLDELEVFYMIEAIFYIYLISNRFKKDYCKWVKDFNFLMMLK